MNRIKKLIAVALSAATVASVGVCGGSLSAGASGTGAGLAEYALNAYYEGWSYVWGGTSPGAVDCSGLIWSYCGGDRMNMLSDAQANGRDWGYVDDGVPRVHGLGLSRPGHVGVYIEDGMEVDARGSDYGVCYQQIGENGWNNWDCWFKLTAVSYPTNGWENFNGNYYYYENGEYIVNTSRTIDGTTYYFDSKGHSGTTPSDTSSTASVDTSSSSSSKSQTSKPTVWKKGSSDDEVVKIQKRLAELGYYNGSIDGDFGDVTDAAFRAFQAAAGLTVDGIAGSDRDVLYSDNAPSAKTETTEPAPTQPATEPEQKPEETQPAATEPATEEPSQPVVVAQNGDFNEQVTNVQTKLSELGYFGIEPTGLFGNFTEEAIKSFQEANGLEVTGVVDAKTYEMLFSDDAVAFAAATEEEAPAEEPATEEATTEAVEETPAEEAAPETEEEAPAEVEEATEAPTAAVSEVVKPSQSVVSGTNPGQYAASASKTVANANKVSAKALEKSSAKTDDSQTAQVKRTANIWLWLILAAAILGIIAFVLLMHSRKQTKKAAKKKTSARAQLNARW